MTTTSLPRTEVCDYASLLDRQPDIWPMPLLAILVWSLAPALAALGLWTAARPRMWLIYVALAVASTVLTSFGAGAFFAPLVVLPLVLTTYLASRVQ